MLNLQNHFSLKGLNTFQVEAFSRYYTEVTSIDELKEAILFSKENQLPILLLGGGSNILLIQDFEGLAISIKTKGIVETRFDENHVIVTAQAGENWHNFVTHTLSKNYGGLENLSLIPGNVGTAPIQNIGAYGVEAKDHFYSCKVLNIVTLAIEELNVEACQFAYRNSIFKTECKGKYVILEVSFKLTTQHHQIKSEYGSIQKALEKMQVENPSIQDISKAVIDIRKNKIPNPEQTGNAGSFFKNPSIPTLQYHDLKLRFGDIPGYTDNHHTKIPAGWLIESCGWKGKQIGNVACHDLQALVILNKTGKATGQEIFDFSYQIINSIENKFGIILEKEVNII